MSKNKDFNSDSELSISKEYINNINENENEEDDGYLSGSESEDLEESFQENVINMLDSYKKNYEKYNYFLELFETDVIYDLSFIIDEFSNYIHPSTYLNNQSDEYKLKLIQFLLTKVPFDVSYVECASRFNQKDFYNSDEYLLACEILETIVNYSIELFNKNKLSKNDFLNVINALIENDKYDLVYECLTFTNIIINKKIFKSIWYSQHFNCLKEIIKKYCKIDSKYINNLDLELSELN
jgi:hypothetical protein